ncbi:MAG: ornithine carbamoyltransferase [Chloroflexi bacterium]|nr:ornithine carbamoyltransferase [Chloroflexota bacterium]
MKHFLTIAETSQSEFDHIMNLAVQLKKEWKEGGNRPILARKTLGLIFQKPSLRTRVSFEMAMQHLGGNALYLSPDEIQLGKRESVADVARVLSRFVDGIMARVFAHSDLEELARYSRVPVINGLSDFSHPCQAVGDLLTILEHKGRLQGVRLAYVGDGNNVAVSLMFAAAKLGLHLTIGCPEGYEPPAQATSMAQSDLNKGATIRIVHDPAEAVAQADVIYTDVWTSMGQEKETEKRLKVFPPYQVNASLLAQARPDAIVMHCLPAHRGQEITDEVADGPHSVLFDQAENRMHGQKAVLAVLMGGM